MTSRDVGKRLFYLIVFSAFSALVCVSRWV